VQTLFAREPGDPTSGLGERFSGVRVGKAKEDGEVHFAHARPTKANLTPGPLGCKGAFSVTKRTQFAAQFHPDRHYWLCLRPLTRHHGQDSKLSGGGSSCARVWPICYMALGAHAHSEILGRT